MTPLLCPVWWIATKQENRVRVEELHINPKKWRNKHSWGYQKPLLFKILPKFALRVRATFSSSYPWSPHHNPPVHFCFQLQLWCTNSPLNTSKTLQGLTTALLILSSGSSLIQDKEDLKITSGIPQPIGIGADPGSKILGNVYIASQRSLWNHAHNRTVHLHVAFPPFLDTLFTPSLLPSR